MDTTTITPGREAAGGLNAQAGTGERLRVLVLAEACNPAWSSVPLVGYNWARALADHPALEVTLATSVRNAEGLDGDPIRDRAEVHLIDTERVSGPAFRLGKWLRGGKELGWSVNTALAWPGYVAFEREVGRRFGPDLAAGRFDLVHRVTPVSPALPSPLAGRAGVPMIVGPLNGGLPWPEAFRHRRKGEREWLLSLRSAYRLLPYAGSTLRDAACVVAASRQTESELLARGARRLVRIPENGVDPARFPIADRWPEPAGPFRFITVGRLVPVKAVDLILEAMAGSQTLRACRLTIVGDGPDRQALQARAAGLGLGDVVEFRGWLPQAALHAELRRAQAFPFPSVKEFGGGVVLEAMAAGLPPIVLNYGGPAELVDDGAGIRLPLADEAATVAALRRAMEALAADRDRCRALGVAAAERVRGEYTWAAKADRMVRLYRDVRANRVPTRARP